MHCAGIALIRKEDGKAFVKREKNKPRGREMIAITWMFV